MWINASEQKILKKHLSNAWSNDLSEKSDFLFLVMPDSASKMEKEIVADLWKSLYAG